MHLLTLLKFTRKHLHSRQRGRERSPVPTSKWQWTIRRRLELTLESSLTSRVEWQVAKLANQKWAFLDFQFSANFKLSESVGFFLKSAQTAHAWEIDVIDDGVFSDRRRQVKNSRKYPAVLIASSTRIIKFKVIYPMVKKLCWCWCWPIPKYSFTRQ